MAEAAEKVSGLRIAKCSAVRCRALGTHYVCVQIPCVVPTKQPAEVLYNENPLCAAHANSMQAKALLGPQVRAVLEQRMRLSGIFIPLDYRRAKVVPELIAAQTERGEGWLPNPR